ncbi:hypothetical protein Syun_001248 [Stephania yunnanensis]|uniref:Beta-Casp domain-containing protein n=1 Tax=Stephania yunnanensis TaxID=152371 RepID=A0AAP0LDH6_9MAGN
MVCHADMDMDDQEVMRRSFINASGPCVLFASPGMISGGFSLEVFNQWAPSEKNLIALPGREAINESQMIPETQSRRSRGRPTDAEESGEQRRWQSWAQPAAVDDRGGDQAAGGGGAGFEQRWRTITEATNVAGTVGRMSRRSRSARGATTVQKKGQRRRFEKRASDGRSKRGGATAIQKKGQRRRQTAAAEEKIAQ